MSVRSRFNQAVKAHKENKLFYQKVNVLVDAIRSQDNALAAALLDNVKAAPQYHPVIKEQLLDAVVQSDNVATLPLLLDNPNYVFSKSYGNNNVGRTAAAHMVVNEHILYAAINAGSENVALALANNKAVNVNAESSSTTYVSFSAEKTPYASPLALAQEKGMTKVAEVLAARGAVATQYRQQPPKL